MKNSVEMHPCALQFPPAFISPMLADHEDKHGSPASSSAGLNEDPS